MFANRARVLIAEAIPPDQLDAGELRERLDDAERRARRGRGGIGRARARPSARSARFEAFLEIAESQ